MKAAWHYRDEVVSEDEGSNQTVVGSGLDSWYDSISRFQSDVGWRSFEHGIDSRSL